MCPTHTCPRRPTAATAIKAAASSAPGNGHTTQRPMHYAAAAMVAWRGPTPHREVTGCKRPRPVSRGVVYMDLPRCGLQIVQPPPPPKGPPPPAQQSSTNNRHGSGHVIHIPQPRRGATPFAARARPVFRQRDGVQRRLRQLQMRAHGANPQKDRHPRPQEATPAKRSRCSPGLQCEYHVLSIFTRLIVVCGGRRGYDQSCSHSSTRWTGGARP
jgi:hypothetical protein